MIRRATALATAALVVATTAGLVQPAAATTSTIDRAERTQLRADVEAIRLAGGIGVVAAAESGGSRFRDASGVRTIDRARPAQPGDTARVASVTKPMVSVLALQEVQRGRLRLSTTVDEVLPGLLPGHGNVTLEQLLSHRSGLPDYIAPLIAGATTNEKFVRILERRYTPRQLVRAALSQPWAFDPGTDFLYSNTGYVVVGLMLEKLNRQPVGRLLERRVFAPAGMSSTVFQTGRSWGQRDHLAGYARLERPINLDRTSASIFYAAGAVESTPADLNRFWRSVLNGTLLRSRWAAEMVRVRTPEASYGLGVLTITGPCADASGRALPLYGHDGATFGTQTLAFSSADGRAQAATSFTGRNLSSTEAPDLLAAIDFVQHAIGASCDRLAETTNRRSATPPFPLHDAPLTRVPR